VKDAAAAIAEIHSREQADDLAPGPGGPGSRHRWSGSDSRKSPAISTAGPRGPGGPACPENSSTCGTNGRNEGYALSSRPRSGTFSEKTRTYPDHPDQPADSRHFRRVAKVDYTRTRPGPSLRMVGLAPRFICWNPWVLEIGAVLLLILVLRMGAAI
jgi:hypothetical protein